FVFAAARGPNAATPLQELTHEGPLDPVQDGYLLTADGSIVHARYSVTYRVRPTEAAIFLSNVVGTETLRVAERNPQVIFSDADTLVRQAVEEAVVADTAARTLDEFLGLGQLRSAAAAQTPVTTPDGGAPEAI